MNQLVKNQVSDNPFGMSNFSLAMEQAKILSQSDIVPGAFRGKPSNVVIALEMAYRMGASPMMVMQNADIILGKFSWSSKFLIACINKSGRFSPIRYETSDKSEGACRAYAKDLTTGEMLHGPWVSIAMAKAEGWYSKKGSKWQTMPELMLRYRSAAFFQRTYAPEISMGFHTTDEIHDMGPSLDENGNTAPEIKSVDVRQLIDDAVNIDRLEEVFTENKLDITKEPALMSHFKKVLKEKLTDEIVNAPTEEDLNSINEKFESFIKKDLDLLQEVGKARKIFES